MNVSFVRVMVPLSEQGAGLPLVNTLAGAGFFVLGICIAGVK